MTYKTIEKIAHELGTEVEYKTYSYWNNIPHINNTALCFNVSTDTNTFGIMTNPEYFPKHITIDYIKEQIECEESNLGLHKVFYNRKPFGAREWFTPAQVREECYTIAYA